MNEGFDIETFRPDDTHALAKFFSEEYQGHEISDNDFLRWEYIDNPFGKAIVTIAKDVNNKIASQYALIPLQFVNGDRLISGTLSLNTLTGKSFRGQGLFTATANAAYRYCADHGYTVTVGVPNENSYPGFAGKLKFRHPGNLRFLMKPLSLPGILKSRVRGRPVRKGAEIRPEFRFAELHKQGVSLFDPDTDKKSYGIFMERWRSRNQYAVNRSMEYLEWRYFRIPRRHYEVFKLLVNDEFKCVIALRFMEVYGMRACVVMDFLSVDEKYGKQLLTMIISEARRNSIAAMIAASASKNSEYNLLSHAGFLQMPEFMLPQRLPFIIKLHHSAKDGEQILDISRWHFTFGDYDIF